jgi:hypothetical protein
MGRIAMCAWSSLVCHFDDDLAEGAAVEVIQRGGQIGEPIAGVDHGHDAGAIDGSHKVL